MGLGEFQSSEELVVLLDVSATGTEVDLCDIRPEGKQSSEDRDNHKAIVSTGILIMRLQELIGKIENCGFFVVDVIIKRLVEFASDDEIEIIDLLGHQDAKLLIQLASFQIILLKSNVSVASFDDYYFHIACYFRKKTSFLFLPFLHPDILNGQLDFF